MKQGLRYIRPGELLYILPTYTAMLQIRGLIARKGHTKKYWEV